MNKLLKCSTRWAHRKDVNQQKGQKNQGKKGRRGELGAPNSAAPNKVQSCVVGARMLVSSDVSVRVAGKVPWLEVDAQKALELVQHILLCLCARQAVALASIRNELDRRACVSGPLGSVDKGGDLSVGHVTILVAMDQEGRAEVAGATYSRRRLGPRSDMRLIHPKP